MWVECAVLWLVVTCGFPHCYLLVKFGTCLTVESEVTALSKVRVVATNSLVSFVAGRVSFGSFYLVGWRCSVVSVCGVGGLRLGSFESFWEPSVFGRVCVVQWALMPFGVANASPSCGSGLFHACGAIKHGHAFPVS